MSDEQRVRIERLRDKSALVLEAGEDSEGGEADAAGEDWFAAQAQGLPEPGLGNVFE